MLINTDVILFLIYTWKRTQFLNRQSIAKVNHQKVGYLRSISIRVSMSQVLKDWFNIQILQTTQICATTPRLHSTTNLSYFFFLLYSLIHSSFPSCSLPFIIFLKLRGQHRTQLITRKTFPLTTHIITLKSIQQTPQLFCSVLTQQHRSHAFMRQQLQLSIPH